MPAGNAAQTAGLQPLQFIVAASTAGVGLFVLLALKLGTGGAADQPAEPSLLTPGALAVAAGALILRSVIRVRLQAAAQARLASLPKDAEVEAVLWLLYRNQVLISTVLLEGPALLLTTVFILTGVIANIIVALLLVALMSVRFPSEAQFRTWLHQCGWQA
ncbi:MAG: hypothetical protein NZ700_10640 [Gemmataceae bacterium]|nr:hypothetical protein [Gemmataceae bacterium]MDW8264446.1 hypothetical protein [Gemmataceae bacterium]